MNFDIEFIYAVIVLIILISIQYTLNLILREIKGLRVTLMTKDDNIRR